MSEPRRSMTAPLGGDTELDPDSGVAAASAPMDSRGAAPTGGRTASSPDRGSQTTDARSVAPEARWGVTDGSPSGGTSGGTPARQVERETEAER